MPQRTLTAWLATHAGSSPGNRKTTTIKGTLSETPGRSGGNTSRHEPALEESCSDDFQFKRMFSWFFQLLSSSTSSERRYIRFRIFFGR